MIRRKFSDHEFAAWLRKQDSLWTYKQRGEVIEYYCKDELVAVVVYNNSAPWIELFTPMKGVHETYFV